MRKTHSFLKFLVILCGVCLFGNRYLGAQAFNWTSLGIGTANGTNGIINAIAVFNGKIIVGGSFTQAGGIPANNIAQWDEETGWASLGNGLNSTVYALQVWNNQLYAGGSFTSVPGVLNVSKIARWTGSTWLTVGFPFQGVNNDVLALSVYNDNLVIAGKFNVAGGNNTANRIVKWTGTNWVPLGSSTINGVNDEVYALTVMSPISGDLLIVGGKFTKSMAGDSLNYIASWDEGNWAQLNRGMDERVYTLTVHDSVLYAGGWFLNAGGISAKYIARWNGINWSSLPKEVDDRVAALVSYRGELVAAGRFKFADTLYVDRIAKWNGTTWSRMITGMNNKVNALCVNDTDLYAGGDFTTAGGKVSRFAARWGVRPTSTVSGTVRYIDNNQIVNRGKVRAVRLDISTREIIVVDTSSISNGIYTLPKVLIDTLYIIVVPNDELEDNFVPTYHDSTIDWRRAVEVYPLNNLSNINVFVIRAVPPEPDVFGSVWIGGHVYLNYLPPMTYGLPYKSDAIVYAKRDGLYRTFAVSNTSEQYRLVPLTPGTYDLAAYRLGFTNASRTVVLASTSIDTIDFYLDTVNPIGIKNINSNVPKNFALYQNYPNPFNPVTIIKFAVMNRTFVTMMLYNILGQDVMTLVNENMEPGEYELTLNASALPSGVYFYRLIAEGYIGTRKMILVK